MPTQINYHELQWLDAYRQAIRQQYPDAVVKMLLFSREGVIAEQHEFSDLNIMLVVPDGMDYAGQMDLCSLGYAISDPSTTDPSIWTYTQSEWHKQRKMRHSAVELAERHGTAVAIP